MARRQTKHIPKYLKEDEIERLFRAMESRRDRAMFRLIYHRGLRASEVGLLQMSDFRRDVGRLFVRRLKGSNAGEFKLLPAELTPLRAWLRERGPAPGPIFPSRKRPGEGIGRKRIFELMREYCRLAGIPRERSHPHCLKHSCGTHLLARERDITVVQDWLGHKSIANTMIYAAITNRTRDDATERVKDWR